jgi:hypothetical protein
VEGNGQIAMLEIRDIQQDTIVKIEGVHQSRRIQHFASAIEHTGATGVGSRSATRRRGKPGGRDSLACPEAHTGRVIRVSDGDTLVVLSANKARHKIRLQGIPARSAARLCRYGLMVIPELDVRVTACVGRTNAGSSTGGS